MLRGLICLPDGASPWAFRWFLFVFISLGVILPMLYALGIGYICYRDGLLSHEQQIRLSGMNLHGRKKRQKQARALSIYFIRLFGVLLI